MMGVRLAQFLVMVYSVAMVAAGQGVDNRLNAFALSLPIEYYVQGCSIMDINSDGLPEVYLSAASGWQYYVYYELDGELRAVEDMEPWAWSSRLLCTTDGKLILYTYPHTTGTDGILNYRVWRWEENGYFLADDLWRMPTAYGWNGEGDENDYNNYGPLEFEYISSDTVIDPFDDDSPYDDWLITREEFERKIEGFNEAKVVLDPMTLWEDDSILYWSDEWWDQYYPSGKFDEDEYDKAIAAIKEEIAEELLTWQ